MTNNCFICGSPKAEENTLCETCFNNPGAYDLYQMKFTELMRHQAENCPYCNTKVMSLPEHYSRNIICMNRWKDTESARTRVPYWEVKSAYAEVIKDAKIIEKKKAEKQKPADGLAMWF